MGDYYLRLEAINLRNFVYDTKDLSTIRGGGLLLLNAVDRVVADVDSVKLTPLMLGASAGLYEFEADDPEKAEQVRSAVQQYLASHQQLKHATFTVDVQPASGEERFNDDLEMLIAKSRWRQMQSPAVAVPAQNDNGAVEACEIDGVRPGAASRPGPENETEWVSASVAVRSDYGREQKKRDFYREQAHFEGEFTRNLDELTSDPTQGNLHHKMAVIYLDGNRFGELKKGKDGNLSRQREFDKTLKQRRQEMLHEFLDMIAGDEAWRTEIDDVVRLRLETLLWGGDEIIWVVPAWRGWRALSFFYQKSREWKFEEARLHHAGGLVFCHYKAPIHRITTLARELADLAKEKDRERSLFAYEVLESFDHVGRDLDAYRKERSSWPLDPSEQPEPKALILAGDDMPDILDKASLLKEKLPRRKLHAMIEHLLEKTKFPDDITRRKTEREKLTEDLCGGLDEQATEELAMLTLKLGGEEARWLHLAALWDYLVMEKR